MSEELKKEIAESTAKVIYDVRAEWTKEVEKVGDDLKNTTAEWKAKEEKMDKEISRIDELEKKLSRTVTEPVVDDAEVKMKLEMDLFRKYAKYGPGEFTNHLTPEDQKVMYLYNDVSGGYLRVPDKVMNSILKDITEIDPIRGLANTISTSGEDIMWPYRSAVATAKWVETNAEIGTRAESGTGSTLTFGMRKYTTWENTVKFKASNWMLEDSAFNLEGIMSAEAAEAMAYLEGYAFILGTGSGEPEGITTNADMIASNYTAQGEAATLTNADGLVKMFWDLKEPYVNNAIWLISRATMKTISVLKDGEGRYILGFQHLGNKPEWSILTKKVYNSVSMPSVAANAFPVFFGDLRRLYLIVDRIGTTMIRDPYTSKDTGIVEFLFRRRTGGGVTLPEAGRLLKIAAS